MCIELDSKAIVEIFNSQSHANTFIFSLIEDYKHMISKIPQTRIRHIFREANRCADFLAKLGASCEDDFIVFSSPPVDLLCVLEADARGQFVSRLCFDVLFAV